MAQNLAVGTFLRIPLADGSFGYARILTTPYLAFYDHNTHLPSADMDLIEAAPILFNQAVRPPADGRWATLGTRPLVGDVAKPVVRFTQDLADYRKCLIYDSAGMKRIASPEECMALERAAAWEPHHIEKRLLDCFAGRPNDTEVRLRVRLA